MFAEKWKLASIAFICSLGLVGYFVYLTVLDERLDHLKHSIGTIHQINADLLMLRRYEKDFLARNDKKYIQTYENNANNLRYKINHLQEQVADYAHILPILAEIEQAIDVYSLKFKEVYQLQEAIGLKKDTGIKGEVLKLESNIEGFINLLNEPSFAKLWYYILKAEKSYLLNLEKEYYSEFNQNISFLINEINAHQASSLTQDFFLQVKTFQEKFNLLVSYIDKRGTNRHEGMLRELGSAAHELERKISHLLQTVLDTALNLETKHDHQTKIMMIFFPLVVLSVALMPFFFLIFTSVQRETPS